MRLTIVPLLASLVAAGTASAGDAISVDPFIGTAAGVQPYAKGNVFPGAVVPNGMVAVSPDTSPRYAGGYQSGAPYIEGFSQNHLSGVGCQGDLGNILVMPTVGPVRTREEQYRSTYRSEIANPGYYGVQLLTPGVAAEMTATDRASISRYVFPARAGDANILIDVSHGLTPSRGGSVRIVSAKEVEGWNDTGGFCGTDNPYKVYFVARFSKSSTGRGTWAGDRPSTLRERTGSDIGAYLRFTTTAEEAISVKVGLSYVGMAEARANVDAEIPAGRRFEQVRAAATARWNADLGRIKVEGGTPEQRRIFYTGLYHTLIHPSVASDVGGSYQGMEGAGTKTASGRTHYHLFSLWDTYRSLHPLLTLLYPERQRDMVRSMVAMAEEGGWLPKWEIAGRETLTMVGDPASIVVADTWLKGVRGFDIEAAYAAMRKAATQTTGNPLRPCLAQYDRSGYVPADACTRKGSVSVTQEYAYADRALALLARTLGKAADADRFATRALSHRPLFDASRGFFRARNADGGRPASFNPLCCALGNGKYEGSGFIEGTAWQYLFMVPHDITWLRTALGGDAAFRSKLDAAFSAGGGYYSLINEPDMLYPYLYTHLPGEAWRTQDRVRRDIAESFGVGRDGLPGNDDAGQTSSRLVFDMIGLYPVDPLSGTYRIGSPVFSKITLTLDPSTYPGSRFTISAPGASNSNRYIRSATLDGRSLATPIIDHAAIVDGGELVLEMSAVPTSWGR